MNDLAKTSSHSPANFAPRKFDIGLSYADHEAALATRLAMLLHEKGLSVFDWRKKHAQLWGAPLQDSVSKIYLQQCKSVLIFVSEYYITSTHCLHELESLASHEISALSPEPLLLPLRIDSYPVPPALAHLTWLSCAALSESQVATRVTERLSLFEDDLRSSISCLETPELLRRISSDRDHRSFEVLYERLLPEILRQAKSSGTADGEALTNIVSEVMLHLWRNTPPATAFVAEHFNGYFRYLVNRCIRLTTHRSRQITDRATPTRRTSSPNRTDHDALQHLISQLAPDDRHLIEQYYGKELPLAEIATTLNASETAIRVRLHRVLAKLKSALTTLDAQQVPGKEA